MNRAERRALKKDPVRGPEHEQAEKICIDFMSVVVYRTQYGNETGDVYEEMYLEQLKVFEKRWYEFCFNSVTKFKRDWFSKMFRETFYEIQKAGYVTSVLEQIDRTFDIYLDSLKKRKPMIHPHRNVMGRRVSKKERRRRRSELKEKIAES